MHRIYGTEWKMKHKKNISIIHRIILKIKLILKNGT